MRTFTLLTVASLSLLTGNALGQVVTEDFQLHEFGNGINGVNFGRSVDISGNTVMVGKNGSAFLYDATTGAELHRLDSNDGVHIGPMVAIDGDRCIVAETFATAGSMPALYVFDTTTGLQVAQLFVTEPQPFASWGRSVALQGSIALVGSIAADGNSPVSGAVYVFDLALGQQVDKFFPGDGQTGDSFGWSMDISGTTVIVGTRSQTPGIPNLDPGSAYLFDVTTGQQLHKLLASDAGAGDLFGLAVAISGTTAIIGAPYWDLPFGAGDIAGAAYLFDTTTGQEVMQIFPSNHGSGQGFGMAVAIRGPRAVVGAVQNGASSPPGSAYVFESSSGVQLARLIGSNATNDGRFGSAVAIGDTATVVGARFMNTAYRYSFGSGGSGGAVGTSYCFGDGSGTACPCNNPGGTGQGCANSSGSGATLSGSGSASIAAGDLVLSVSGLVPQQAGLYFQGVNGGNGIAFGDGLRCVGGTFVRLQVVVADAQGVASSNIDIASGGNAAAGQTLRYQVWYRDPTASPCQSGFNLSNGLEVVWMP